MLEGGGGKWQLPPPLFLEKSSNKVQNQYKYISFCLPQILCKLSLLCCLSVGYYLFKGGDPAINHTPGLPIAESDDFKATGTLSSLLYKLTEFSPSGFQSQVLWGFISMWALWCLETFSLPSTCSSLIPVDIS